MLAIRSLPTTTLSLLFILHLWDDIAEGKRQNKVAHKKIKYPVLYQVEKTKLISPANYLANAGNVERIQHYASVDTRKRLEPNVAGERYKPVCTVDRALRFIDCHFETGIILI